MTNDKENLVSIIIKREPSTYFLMMFAYVVSAFTLLKDVDGLLGIGFPSIPPIGMYIAALCFAGTCLFAAKRKWQSGTS